MSTEKNFKLRKGLNYLIKARGVGIYDEQQVYVAPLVYGEYKLKTTVYDVLKMEQSTGYNGADVLSFSETKLPWKWDYGTSLQVSEYCLMPKGKIYDDIVKTVNKYTYNFSVVGTPTIDNKIKSVSDFSTRNAITLPEIFAPESNSWELCLKFTTGSDITTRQKLNGSADSVDFNFPTVEITQSTCLFAVCLSSNGSSWDIASTNGTYQIQANTTYWIKFGFSGSEYYLEYSLDGETYTRDITVSNNFPIYQSGYLMGLGNDMWNSSSQAPFLGTIDLSETYININEERWWTPEFIVNKVPQMQANIENGGNDEDGIMTSFILNETKTPDKITVYKDKSFEGKWKVKTGSSSSDDNHFIQTQENGFYIRTGSGYFWGVFYINGSETYSKISISVNTEYWVKVSYDPETFTIKWEYSNDDSLWTTIKAQDLTTYFIGPDATATSFTFDLYFGASGTSVWTGSIDFNQSYFKVDGKTVWSGVKLASKSLAGCTYNYLDTGQATTLNCFVINGDESIVLSPEETYENARFLGTVNIQKHNVYETN